MKVVRINGSARDNGSCAYILEKVKEAMGQNFTEIIKYDISKMHKGYRDRAYRGGRTAFQKQRL